MSEEENYLAFDDDAEEVQIEEKPKKERKFKLNKEGSKKNKKAKCFKGFLKKIAVAGIVLGIGASVFGLTKDDTAKTAPSKPQDDYYLTVNFTDVENADLDDLFIYSEGDIHSLVYKEENSGNIISVCDNYVIPRGAIEDSASSLTPLEGTQLLDEIIEESNVISADKIDMLSFVGTQYYISVDAKDVRTMLTDSDCAKIVSKYTSEDGSTYDNLSDYLVDKVNANELNKSK